MRLQAQRSLLGLGAVVTWCASALAGSANYDFNSAPPADLQFVLSQSDAGWRDTGGVNNTGYVALFDSINSQYAAVMIPDFDNGLIVKAFTFECELRVGNAVGNDGRPADGFSINYARATDPVVTQLAQEPPVDPRNDFAIPGAPEGGTTTGLSICFDTWSGNTWPSGETDIEGIILRVDNVTKAKVAMPVRNGSCTDATSLQTGPYNPDLAGAPDELCWAPLKVDLAENGEVTVTWKGTVIVDKVQTGFLPSAGRIVLAGRTGGANENTHIDNLKITTVAADKALVTGVGADALGVTVTLDDSGQSVVNPDTIALTVDGAAATPLAKSKVDKTTTVRWNSPAYLTANAVLSLGISFKDTQNAQITDTRPVTVAAYAMIPPAYRVPTASVNTARKGFLMRPYQTEAAQPNTLIWTEGQLLGLYGENIADLSGATAGLYTRDTVINFNMDAPNAVGNFSSANGYDDEMFPGYPSVTGGTGGITFTGNSTEEVLTYIDFPAAGLYQLGVNSDDGFRVTAGRAPGDLLGVILGFFDAGRGASDTIFSVLIDQPGIYPIRLIWENGNGELPGNGANLEFFSVKNGVKTLVNDTTADALKAYRESTAAGPYVSDLSPLRGATGVPADVTIMAEISHGSVQVDAATVKTKLNGTDIPATVTPAGAKTTVTLPPTGLLPSGTPQTVVIEFSDKSTPPAAYTTTWQFGVGTYVSLPPELVSPLGSEDKTKPGFNVKTWQLEARGNTQPNNNEWAEGALAGLVGPNVADLTGFTGGIYPETETINYSHPPDENNGNFTPDRQHPGIPGTTGIRDNYQSEFVTYIPFDKPGYHVMGVNSDDNFRVTIGDKVGRQYIEVLAPSAIAGGMAAAVTAVPMNVNPGFGGPIPAAPIVADAVVLGTSCLADPALPDLTGKIAVIPRGTCTFVEKSRNAQAKGALAVIICNNAANEINFPIVMGGEGLDVTIPVMMVDYDDGQRLINNPTGLRVSIGKDTNLQLGEFNGNGRGASDTLFSFYVPQAGVYPFRCFYMQGGGGANVEWFTVKDGTRLLVNDTATGALKTYRARTFSPKPTIGIAAQGGNVVITFTGGLQASDNVTGPWTDVTTTSPYTAAPSEAKKFYRSKQ